MKQYCVKTSIIPVRDIIDADAEVDDIHAYHGKICPIEVKAEKT